MERKKMLEFEELRQAMINAEDRGLVYNSVFGVDSEPCTYWVVGDFIVTYLTDDEVFDATMLTEDMMDDLIVEER